MSAHVLLVDDEPQLVRALRPVLLAVGYSVSVAETGEAAISHVATTGADAILLDLGLPDMDGKDVIARVREWSSAPVIVLSARDDEREKISALDLGADDYVSKPFAVGELLARLRAALRGREVRFNAEARFSAGDLTVDFGARRATLAGEDLRLTHREFALLGVLARHRGRVVTHRQIAAAVWGQERESVDPQFTRVLVSNLRSKIELNPAAPKLLVTEPGLGYRLADDSL